MGVQPASLSPFLADTAATGKIESGQDSSCIVEGLLFDTSDFRKGKLKLLQPVGGNRCSSTRRALQPTLDGSASNPEYRCNIVDIDTTADRSSVARGECDLELTFGPPRSLRVHVALIEWSEKEAESHFGLHNRADED